MNQKIVSLAGATVCGLFTTLHPVFAQRTAFTYQRILVDGAGPAGGIYDLRFGVFDAPVAGSQQGGPVTNSGVAIRNGLFAATLDFGNPFDGTARWLEIAARTNGGGGFITLSPRQPVMATPYAITAGGIGNPLQTGIATTNYVLFSFTNYAVPFITNFIIVHLPPTNCCCTDLDTKVDWHVTGNPITGMQLMAGSGSWTSLSDRNAKEHFQAIDPKQVLDRLIAVPVGTWNYKAQPAAVRHLGPTAQDFKAAFELGETDKGISTVDEGGVALAAIQGLNQRLTEELKLRDRENAALKERLDHLERLIAANRASPR